MDMDYFNYNYIKNIMEMIDMCKTAHYLMYTSRRVWNYHSMEFSPLSSL